MKQPINLLNTGNAFAYKNTKDLRFTYYIFKMLQYPTLMKSLTAVAQKILQYNVPLTGLIRSTIFKVFCSGENIGEAFNTIQKLDKYQVKSVLDYVSEAEKTEEAFYENKKIIVDNISRLAVTARGNAVSVKLSGLEDHEFFRRINNTNTLRSTDDEHRYNILLKRLDCICRQASEKGILVYIDAEDHYMQDVFDHLTEIMMERYNTQTATVYNTLQMYLTDRPEYLKKLLDKSRSKKFYPGIKLVRGAYVEKEKEAARLAGIPSPVYHSKTETDAAFNQAVELCLANHDYVYTCIASHNLQSTEFALECINRYNIQDHTSKVKFSQLLGMSDHLTFNLAAAGFNASKYLPYGEIKKAIPYLIRRAEENSSIGGQISEETNRLKEELFRRKTVKQ